VFSTGRLVAQLVGALVVPAGGAVWVGTHLFSHDPGHRAAWTVVVPAAAGALVAGAAVFWLLLAPVRRGLRHPEGPGAAERRARAAEAALAAPGRISGAVLGLSVAAIAGVVAQRLGRGRPADIAAAAAMAATAFAVMGAMLAYSLASAGLARALVSLGPQDLPGRGSMRLKVMAVAAGLLAFAMLLGGPLAYARYREDIDLRYLAHAERALALGAAALPERGAAGALALASAAAETPVALVGPGSAADVDPALAAPAEGPPVEPVPGGWRLRHALGGGRALVAFLPEAPLLERRRAFWATSGALALAVFAATTLLVWLVARSLAEPLRIMGSAAVRVAAGDLTAAPPSVTRDEMGQLAADFRRMTYGLASLVQDVQEASRGVLGGTVEMEAIGSRVRAGAGEERQRVGGARDAVASMQDSARLAGQGVEGLSGYVVSTSTAVAEMTAALAEVRRQAAELEQLAEGAGRETERLAEAGGRAQAQLGALDSLAGHAGKSLSAVSASLASLENSAVASQLAAAQAAELADHAGLVVREASSRIEGVRAAVADAQQRVSRLGRRSDDIDKVLDFIGEVAGRTNLLSLNASIIATQAGEHGKAFAVVAEQIRELASQIATSTKSIGEIIRAVRDDVDGTARLIDRGDSLAAGAVAQAHLSLGALDEIRTATVRGHEAAAAIQGSLQAHSDSAAEVSHLIAAVADNSHTLSEAAQMVGSSVAAVGSVTAAVRALADQVSRALEEQSGLGQRQLGSLERINEMIAEVSRAMERHEAATHNVHDSLSHLAGTAQLHETAVAALAGVAGRLGAHSRALAARVGRFRVQS
jgi:methyl-accepting chemotaxis protein